ncbi:S1 family peptidase [Paenibacillus agilis]|nr:S1 family peptidase [Paenibacillus agilis]
MNKILCLVVFLFIVSIFVDDSYVDARPSALNVEHEVSEEQIAEEMVYLMQMQEKVSEILGSYEAIQDYGTVHIDRSNGFKIVIGFKVEDSKTARIKAELGELLSNRVAFVPSKFTYHELNEIKDQIIDQKQQLESTGTVISSVGVDEAQQRVNVTVTEAKDLKSLNQLSEVSKAGNDVIHIVIDPEAKNYTEFSRRDNHTILGGGIGFLFSPYATHNYCTTAFTATKDEKKFIVTAGHCLNGNQAIVKQWDNNVGRDHVSYFSSKGIDVGLIDVTNSGRKISNSIFKNAVTNYDAKYTQSGSFVANQYVCKSGLTTGYTCGQVQETSTSFEDSITGITVRDVVKIVATGNYKDYSQGGDSGSITWAGDVLLGIHSAGGDSQNQSWGYAAKTSKMTEYFGTTFKINKSSTPF